NRYTYCMNNPLAFTDPTGYGVLGDLWHDITHAIHDILSNQYVQMAIGIGLTALAMEFPGLLFLKTGWLAGAYVSAAYSGISTLASGGSIAEALQQTAFTFATAAVWHGVGDMLGEDSASVAAENEADLPTRIAVHGLVGGGIQAAEGGNFADGFLSAAAAEATPLNEIGTDFSKTSVVAERTIAAGIVGGTVASATGGDFINGAKTAAFAEMFNDEAHLLAEAEKATANFFVGVGDGATFGATAYGRPAGTIDTNSWSYRLGHFFGGGAVAYLGGEAGFAVKELSTSLRTAEIADRIVKSVRTEPNNLSEKLALDEAKAGAGKEIMKGRINDPAYSSEEFSKIAHYHSPLDSEQSSIEIHYWRNNSTGEQFGYKFK
ncbi:MAG: hypothetical protein ABIH77_02225, partial [Pseudomonadota bacterium]